MNIIAGGATMLQSGKSPPTAGSNEDLESLNFLTSKKFFVIFSSIAILVVFFFVGVGILFITSLYPLIIVPYVTIFSKIVEILAVIIAVYIGAQTTLDFKYGSTSAVNLSGENSNLVQNLNQSIAQIDEGRSKPDYEEE